MDAESTAPDELDAEIASKKAKAAEMERALNVLRIEIGALRRAAELRPNRDVTVRPDKPVRLNLVHPSPASTLTPPPIRKGGPRGREKGTLSMQWRTIMRSVVEMDNEYMNFHDWATLARDAGVEISETAVRDWLRRGGGARAGFIERNGDLFRVAPAAIQKFALDTPKPPHGEAASG